MRSQAFILQSVRYCWNEIFGIKCISKHGMVCFDNFFNIKAARSIHKAIP